MNKKEILNKMKEFISMGESVEETVESVEVDLMEVVTKDGIVLLILEDGSVMIGDEVAPDGEYILEDDSVLIVKDGMKVEEEVVEEEVVEEEMAEEVVEEEMAEEEIVEEVNEVVELTARVEGLELALAELLSQFENKTTEMNSQIKALSNEPAEEEIVIKKSFSKSKEKNSILEQYANARKNK